MQVCAAPSGIARRTSRASPHSTRPSAERLARGGSAARFGHPEGEQRGRLLFGRFRFLGEGTGRSSDTPAPLSSPEDRQVGSAEIVVAPQKLPPAVTSRQKGLGPNPQHCSMASRTDEVDRNTAAPVGDALERPMCPKRAGGPASGGRARHVLGILPEGGGALACLIELVVRFRGRVGHDRRRRRRGGLPPLPFAAPLTRGKNEQRREPEQYRAGEDQHRARRARVEGMVEQSPQAVNHWCRPPRRTSGDGRSRRPAPASRRPPPARA